MVPLKVRDIMTDSADKKAETAQTERKPEWETACPAATKEHEETAKRYDHVYPVILAGGSGVRLWPESRPDWPKQFLSVSGKQSMLEDTFERISSVVAMDHVFVVTSTRDAGRIKLCLPNVLPDHIIAEPLARNTAPAIGMAALELLNRDPDAIMVVLPSDHFVEPVSEFCRALDRAVQTVQAHPNQLVVFGIKPTSPATQYGYIEIDSGAYHSLDVSPMVVRTFAVSSFHEKPNRETAAKYLETGRFYWNSGMFVWRADRIVELLKQFEPELVKWVNRVIVFKDTAQERNRSCFDETMHDMYEHVKKIPIDRAVLERASDLCMVEATFRWDDLGSFTSLAALDGKADGDGNIITGKNVILHHSTQNIVRQFSDELGTVPLLALLGVDDLVVVQTPGAILVCKKEEQEKIPEMLEKAGISFVPDKVSRG
ncbi:MAG: sugar phosphate nucleotidyltransferase [Thermoguttaceae bacterium]|nr:sugar phosphate nucleotidyltransferase [Thermoguttaceae bacterium]